MIHDHLDNDRWTRSDLEQQRHFLISHDPDTSAYRLAHEQDSSDGDGDAHVAPDGGERSRNGNEGAFITWSTALGDTRVQTDLEPQFTIAFNQPEHSALFTDLPAETFATALALEREVPGDRVGTSDPGSHVALDSDGGRWRGFLIEPHGEIVTLAKCSIPWFDGPILPAK